MTVDTDNDERFDRVARALHAEAVGHVPAQTLAQLRPRPDREPRRVSGGWATPLGWSLATACAAALVFAVGTRGLLPPDTGGPAPAPALAGAPAPAAADPFEDPLITLEEDPDLFVWLASDAQPLALE